MFTLRQAQGDNWGFLRVHQSWKMSGIRQSIIIIKGIIRPSIIDGLRGAV